MKPFIRKKKIKGHEYLYEITPYFDEISGKWKQKTKYLGRNIDGAPVRKTRIPKTGGVYDFGQYIPAHWAIREYKLFEALLSCFSPEEVSLLLVLAINRLILPCSIRQVNSWLSGTWISHLIPGVIADPISIFQLLLQKSISPLIVAGVYWHSRCERYSDVGQLCSKLSYVKLINIEIMNGKEYNNIRQFKL